MAHSNLQEVEHVWQRLLRMSKGNSWLAFFDQIACSVHKKRSVNVAHTDLARLLTKPAIVNTQILETDSGG